MILDLRPVLPYQHRVHHRRLLEAGVHVPDEYIERHLFCAKCGELFTALLATPDAVRVFALAESNQTCRWHN